MTVTIVETRESQSGRSSIGKETTLDYSWRLKGSDDLATLLAAIDAVRPTSITDPIWDYTLEPADIRWNRIGFQLWDFTFTYADVAWIEEHRQLDTGASRFSYSTTGGTLRIFTSLETVARYTAAGYAVPTPVAGQGSPIGITPEGVEGCDIVVPAMQFSFDYRHPKANITIAEMATMMEATGTTNSATWKTSFPAGSVLFLGKEGSQGIKSDPTHRYNFAYQKNLTSQVIGAISGIAKKGHEYLWVVYEETVDAVAKTKTKRPIQVHVEKVYQASNFATLFPF
jgi:hypothetical protein